MVTALDLQIGSSQNTYLSNPIKKPNATYKRQFAQAKDIATVAKYATNGSPAVIDARSKIAKDMLRYANPTTIHTVGGIVVAEGPDSRADIDTILKVYQQINRQTAQLRETITARNEQADNLIHKGHNYLQKAGYTNPMATAAYEGVKAAKRPLNATLLSKMV